MPMRTPVRLLRQCERHALARLDAWVPELHPTARKQPNGAWRIRPTTLGATLRRTCPITPLASGPRRGERADADRRRAVRQRR